MSDWIEEIITQVKTEEFNCYLDLFEFNGHNPPKFLFGDRVVLLDRTGVVLGLEWRDGVRILPRGGSQNAGWWYAIRFEGRQSLMSFHEDSLKLEEINNGN